MSQGLPGKFFRPVRKESGWLTDQGSHSSPQVFIMRKFFRALLLLPLLTAGIAYAAGQAFDQAGFDALQQQKKPILVAIHADWCPTCKAQEPVLTELLKTPEFQAIHALRVDFDKQKKIVKAFKAQYQSTLIVFKDGKEVGRSTGDTSKDGIAALLKKAL